MIGNFFMLVDGKKSITGVDVWGIIVMFVDCQFIMFRIKST